jgi:hypothetical protein
MGEMRSRPDRHPARTVGRPDDRAEEAADTILLHSACICSASAGKKTAVSDVYRSPNLRHSACVSWLSPSEGGAVGFTCRGGKPNLHPLVLLVSTCRDIIPKMMRHA